MVVWRQGQGGEEELREVSKVWKAQVHYCTSWSWACSSSWVQLVHGVLAHSGLGVRLELELHSAICQPL